MPAERVCPAGRPAGGDGGFSLSETIVSLALVTTVLAAATPFLVRSIGVVQRQRTTQGAIRVVQDAMDQARAVQGQGLLEGRGQAKATTQWNAAAAAVQPYLAVATLDWDHDISDPNAGDQAPLTTAQVAVTVDATTFQRSIYVGRCRQQAGLMGGACTPTDTIDPDPLSVDVPYFRVVVAATWPQNGCVDGQCSYVASMLVSAALDPSFKIKRPPPTVPDPGTLIGYRTRSLSRQLLASGGQLPLRWSATGLPGGLSISTAGLVTGTPGAAGTVIASVTAIDRAGDADTTPITWKIVEPLSMTNPGTQTSHTSTTVSLQLSASGGAQPIGWSADVLPDGLALDPSTGLISGLPTTAQLLTVKLTATDQNAATTAVTVSWRVYSP